MWLKRLNTILISRISAHSPILAQVIKLPFKRFCAIYLNSTIIISVYLPTDYRSSNSDDDFLLTLGELGGFINSHSFDNVIIGGDFNTDFDNLSFTSSGSFLGLRYI